MYLNFLLPTFFPARISTPTPLSSLQWAGMDAFSHRRSPPADRFLGIFSSPPGDLMNAAAASDGPGVELREDEVMFWAEAEISYHQGPSQAANHRRKAVPLRSSTSSRGSSRNLSGESLGILAALPEKEAGKPGFLWRRNPSLSSPAPLAIASPSSARMIPAITKPKHAGYYSAQQYYQSAPVNVPVASGRRRGGFPAAESDSDNEEMLPPHQIVLASRKGAPATTSSVLEGAGRTLKGRDLRRVRNAVWRQTGFLDCN